MLSYTLYIIPYSLWGYYPSPIYYYKEIAPFYGYGGHGGHRGYQGYRGYRGHRGHRRHAR